MSGIQLNEIQTSFIKDVLRTITNEAQASSVIFDYVFSHISDLNYREAQQITDRLINNPPTSDTHTVWLRLL